MRFMFAALAALAAATSLSACTSGSQAETKDKAATIPLTVRTAGVGELKFQVEVARTPEEQERGLMFRTSLPANGGMIFPYDPPRPASFWMKNTLIPLDMIFIRKDGTIARIVDNTTPESLEPVQSGEPVAAVLELAGGRAAELGLAEGDKVAWKD